MYQALYRQERPETFDEVLGQPHVVKILKNQIEKGQVGHAYLFCGTRGTGKTTVARLLAKGVNCLNDKDKPCGQCENCRAIQNGTFIDVIEIDGASNNGIDSVRELRESVNYPPAVGKKKVYIIDEAHELTTQAMNALLKTLEEPPENVIFILATTDPQHLLQTILSRCIRLDFHRISDAELKNKMNEICRSRGIEIADDALTLLAANADGSARDAFSLLDQCLAGADKDLSRDTVLEYLGIASDDFFIKLTDKAIQGRTGEALILLEEVLRDGKDIKQLLAGWMNHYRSLLIGKYVDNPEGMLNMSSENIEKLMVQAKSLSVDDINNGISTIAETINDARYSSQSRILMEMAIVKLSGESSPSLEPVAITRTLDVQKDVRAKDVDGDNDKSAGEKIDSDKIVENKTVEIKIAENKIDDDKTAESNELDAVWEQIWDRVSEIGSLTMVRVNSTLGGITEEEFKLLISNKSTVGVAERNRGELESAMSEILGRPVKMVIKEVEASSELRQESMFSLNSDEQREGDNLWDEFEGESAPSWDEDEDIKKNIQTSLNISNVEIIDE